MPKQNYETQRSIDHLEARGNDYKLVPRKRLKNAWRKSKEDGSKLSLRQFAKWCDTEMTNQDGHPDILVEAANKWLASKSLPAF